MSASPIAIERESQYNVAYLRYGPAELVEGRTVGYADGQVNVDLDESGAIVGIEILRLGADELTVLAEIAKAYDLDLSPLIGGAIPSPA